MADDYYKRGLAINRELAKVERAAALGVVATITLDTQAGRVAVTLADGAAPASIRLMPF